MQLAVLIIGLVGIVGLGVFIVLLIERRRKKLNSGELSFVRNQWRLISSMQNPLNSILEADKLLDFVLGKLGYVGSLGDKLKRAQPLFSNINAIWAAHKLRNRLAHELSPTISQAECKRALASFEEALRDLKIDL
jgi:hypothetical protein